MNELDKFINEQINEYEIDVSMNEWMNDLAG